VDMASTNTGTLNADYAMDEEAPPSVIASVHTRPGRTNCDTDTASPVNSDIVMTAQTG